MEVQYEKMNIVEKFSNENSMLFGIVTCHVVNIIRGQIQTGSEKYKIKYIKFFSL